MNLLHVWGFTCKCGYKQLMYVFLSLSHHFVRQGLTPSLGFTDLARLAGQQASRICLSPVLALQIFTAVPRFLMRSWDANSGSCVCIARILHFTSHLSSLSNLIYSNSSSSLQ